ncbi:MAG: serine/threonine-protein kinase [Rubricoccaceae bacterium]
MPLAPDRWTEADTLFDAALQRPADERTAWLRAECGGDPELYHAVAALLKADAEAEGALGESATSFASGLIDAVQRDQEAALPVDTRVGAYRIVGELGRGGMGTVYRAARADGTFEKEVALKLVKRGMDTDEVLRRFRSERQILAGLEHPNIARLLDAGAADDGRPFVAMELVDGQPITDYAEARQLDRPARLALFEQAVEAVAYAHRRLVVHRDLKPSNVLVTETDSGPSVKLLDFGIARLLDTDVDGLTRPEMRVLTPEYAAPEQVRGEPPTAAIDVYALGVVLHELLTGTRPASSTPTSLPGDLGTLVRTALHEDPERRYGSAEALLDDLRRLRERLPLRARPDSVGYRARRFIDRHRAGVAATALALVALIGGMAFYTARVTTERNVAQAERDRAEATSEFVTSLFNAADPFASPTERPDTLRARDLLQRGAERARTTLADAPGTRADVLTTIGNALAGLSLYSSADSMLTEAVEAARTDGSPDRILNALLAQGHVRALGEDPGEALPVLREAVELAEQSVPRQLAAAHFALGGALRRTNDLDDAVAMLDQALGDTPRDSLQRAGVLLERARVEQDRGRPADAEPYIREALALQRGALPPEHPALAEATEMMGVVVQDQGRLEDAETFLTETYRIRLAALGEDHIQTASARFNLAGLYRTLGRTDEALQTYTEILALDRKRLGPDHPYVGYVLLEIGITHSIAKRHSASIEAYREAIDVMRRSLPEDDQAVTEAMGGIGHELTKSGRAREGEPILRRVLTIRQASLGTDSWRTGVIESVLGGNLMQQGRLPEAERHLVNGYETIREGSGPEGAALQRLIELYKTTRQPDRAAPYEERLAEIGAS